MKKLLSLLLVLVTIISCCNHTVDEKYAEAISLHNSGEYEDAFKIYAQISVDTGATWRVRCNALFAMSLIEDAVNKDRAAAIRYINRCIELATPNEFSFLYAYKCDYSILYAYKGDYSMHYGVPDSAIYYCKKALSMPHDNRTEYVAHYALYNSYQQKGLMDSAFYHKQLFDKVCESGKLDAYSTLTDDAFNKELQSKLEIQHKDDDNNNILYLIVTVAVALIIIIIYSVKKWHKTHHAIIEPHDDIVNSIESCKQCFEQTETFLLLNELRIKEKELYKTSFDKRDLLEKEVFQSFNKVNAVLIDKYKLSADELMCCDCSYIGISNNVIAYISYSSPAAIRKRKERLRHKLSPLHYSVFFKN